MAALFSAYVLAMLLGIVFIPLFVIAFATLRSASRAFLLATARNLVTDRLRRGRVVRIEAVGDPDVLNVIVDELSPERQLGGTAAASPSSGR